MSDKLLKKYLKRDDYINEMQKNFNKCIEIAKAKSSDYSGNEDPFKNFRMSTMFGVPVEKGILVRIGDKIARIGTLIDGREVNVKDESIQDTLLDAINYLNILSVWLKHDKESQGVPLMTDEDHPSYETFKKMLDSNNEEK